MIDFKTRYISSLIRNLAPNKVNEIIQFSGYQKRVSPTYMDLFNYANFRFETFINQGNVLLALKNYGSSDIIASKYDIESKLDDITLHSNSLYDAVNNIITDYFSLTKKYTKICQRLLNENSNTKKKIGQLLDYVCVYVDIQKDIDNSKSMAGIIGNYITIPFNLQNVQIYNNTFYVTIYSSENILFNNLDELSSLPLTSPMVVKYNNDSGFIKNDVMFNCTLVETQTNLIYIKANGDINSIKIVLQYKDNTVYSGTVNDKEALFNFKPMTITSMKITVNVSNLNLNKNVGFQIEDILLFNNVKFAREGLFETKPITINNPFKTKSVGMNLDEDNISNLSYVDRYMSISLSGGDNKNYFKVNNNEYTDQILSLEFTNTHVYLLGGTDTETVTVKSKLEKQIKQKYYKKKLEYNENYKNAQILLGTNDSYMNAYLLTFGMSCNVNIYENWTKKDNVYLTNILNNESGVQIDIGSNTIKVNNVPMTGVITIPKGVSLIEVHQSLFDPTLGLGKDYSEANYRNLLIKRDKVVNDPLYPYNFAYLLAGLPDYNLSPIAPAYDELITEIITQQLTGITSIQTQYPFFPGSLQINSYYINDINSEYKLHLGNSPLLPGTFTIEPYNGRVIIYPKNKKENINISYIRASRDFRPCGLLFNRLCKFLSLKSIQNMMITQKNIDNTYFTCTNDKNGNIYFMIPEVKAGSRYEEDLGTNFYTYNLYNELYNTKIMYNSNETEIYTSVKLSLKSLDSDLSPLVKNISIEGK